MLGSSADWRLLGLRTPAFDDSIVSATVWVPLVTAAVGLIAGLGTSIFTQRRADSREDVRWQRERQDRQEQWQQERQTRQELWEREDSHRWLQDRQQAYARLMAALYTWDDELRRARADRKVAALLNERSELDTPGAARFACSRPRRAGPGGLDGPGHGLGRVRASRGPRKRTGSSSGPSAWREMSPLILPRRTRPGLALERLSPREACTDGRGWHALDGTTCLGLASRSRRRCSPSDLRLPQVRGV